MFVVCGTQHWRAELPPGWCAQHGPGNVAIYHPDGAGAVQVSSLRKLGGDVTDADLRGMAAAAAGGAELRPAWAGEFAGLYCESEHGGAYWVRWFVSRGRVALHVTYNCATAVRGREREAVERVVASLKCPLTQSPAERYSVRCPRPSGSGAPKTRVTFGSGPFLCSDVSPGFQAIPRT